MTDFLNIGSTPPDEECLPLSHPKARAETVIYRRQLEREFPHGRFSVKAFSHDFGTYHEVVAWMGTEEEREAAFEAEASASPYWDDQALTERAQLLAG